MRKYATASKLCSFFITAVVICILWLPAIAHAADGSGSGAGSGSAVAAAATDTTTAAGSASDLLFILLKIVFTILGILATYLTTKAITYFEAKTKIDIPAATEKTISDWADQAVGLAYEKSHQVLQKTGQKLDGNAKLSIATDFVMGLVKKYNLDQVAETKVKDVIESKLGTKRIDDTGVSQPATPAPAPVIAPKTT